MKVYKFFKIPSRHDRDNIDIEQKYVLYAITNNKEFANRFKEERNMKKFIYKVHDGVSKEEYAEMCNEDRTAVLELYRLRTVLNNNHTLNNSEEREILMTYWEKQLIDEPPSLLEDEAYWKDMPYPLLFKNKYVDVLNTLQYISLYKLMASAYLPFELIQRLSTTGDDDYSAPSFEYDNVAIFININEDTF